MKDNPLVSIITVCYNSEEYIRDAIESVLNQTYNNIEYIIIDGNSTDDTLGIIKEYEPKFNESMRWISEKDDGIYDAMNKGVSIAQGEWLYFMGDDDTFVNKNILRKLKSKFNNKKIDFLYGNVNRVTDRKILSVESYKNVDKLFFIGNTICHQAIFARKNVFEKIGNFSMDYEVKADYDWMLKSYFNNNINFKYCDLVIANYRAGGFSGENKNKINAREYYKIAKKHYNNLFYIVLIEFRYRYFLFKQFIKNCMSNK